MAMKPVIDPDLCTACEACVEACPAEALSMNEDETCAVVDLAKCVSSGECEDACPTGAIELEDQ